ncbi:chemotaxis protein CheB [Variovorax sp. J22G73]|uniref:chemotaxis protein CheB n=1 Tax=unclassified Variovorax TaxID=663243 RepID=UPI0025755BAD|nr:MULTISPECIES: chemotaxis protein CheB [unclassified Variovorax]MDM0009524.1 chemotaxis protein CheB [Variovorax sp. J22R203]MDM0102032.1 chemotaxis protein CheB [Variovorax sp. J22G73]
MTFQNNFQTPGGPLRRAVFIGASAGGVFAILELAAALRANFPVPMFFVQHIGAHRSEIALLMNARGPNFAVEARDGDLPAAGSIHVAPPDHHMLLEGGLIRVVRGPKEHHARPAIDPLFRSAALELGVGAIGVVLTGMLDDGSAGLRAIKDCGGTAVVQDPDDAFEPSMPRAALAVVRADHVVPMADMAALLLALALANETHDAAGGQGGPAPSDALRGEHAVGEGEGAMQTLKRIATPSTFSCPDCGGVLFELEDKHPVRYRCHTGHAFSLRSLAATQEQATDAALWSALRALQEKEALLRRLACLHRARDPARAALCENEAEDIVAAAIVMRRLAVKSPSPSSYDV